MNQAHKVGTNLPDAPLRQDREKFSRYFRYVYGAWIKAAQPSGMDDDTIRRNMHRRSPARDFSGLLRNIYVDAKNFENPDIDESELPIKLVEPKTRKHRR